MEIAVRLALDANQAGRLELLDLNIQRLYAIRDLAWGHAEDAGCLGLDPAGLLERGDDAFAFRMESPVWAAVRKVAPWVKGVSGAVLDGIAANPSVAGRKMLGASS